MVVMIAALHLPPCHTFVAPHQHPHTMRLWKSTVQPCLRTVPIRLAGGRQEPRLIARFLENRPALKKTYRKLVTSEDRFSTHKTLGIFCLLHATYRLARVGPADMGFGPTFSTLVCILLHATLSMSSFLFRIPLQRREGSLSYGMWDEYRLQSIVFTMRSLAMMLLIWVEAFFGMTPNYALNALILFASLAASDLSSWSVGPQGRSRTVRDLDAPHATRLLFSIMQIQTTSALMLGQRRFSMHFIFVLVMQFNAFLMTLRRKNLVRYWAAVTLYAIMTIVGSAIVLYETSISQPGLFLVGNALGNLAASLRIGVGAPKYPLWIGMGGLAHLARKTLPPPMGPALQGAQAFPHWPILALASNLCIVAVGWFTRPISPTSSIAPQEAVTDADESSLDAALLDADSSDK